MGGWEAGRDREAGRLGGWEAGRLGGWVAGRLGRWEGRGALEAGRLVLSDLCTSVSKHRRQRGLQLIVNGRMHFRMDKNAHWGFQNDPLVQKDRGRRKRPHLDGVPPRPSWPSWLRVSKSALLSIIFVTRTHKRWRT